MIAATPISTTPGTIESPSISRQRSSSLSAASTMSASRMPMVIAS